MELNKLILKYARGLSFFVIIAMCIWRCTPPKNDSSSDFHVNGNNTHNGSENKFVGQFQFDHDQAHYEVIIDSDNFCTYEGGGYQTYFVYECVGKHVGDKYEVHFKKLLEGSAPYNTNAPELTLFFKKGELVADWSRGGIQVTLKPMIENQAAIDENAVKDIDGNVYEIVRIGNQVWMAENLRVKTYHNGTAIPNVADQHVWSNLESGAWTWYGNDSSNEKIYGKLYNWYAATDTCRICPKGWHLPKYEEWEEMVTFLGGWKEAGKRMKELEHWKYDPVSKGSTASLFSALPSGTRQHLGNYFGIQELAGWWSNDDTYPNPHNFQLYYNSTESGFGYHDKATGLAIRCVKD